LDGPAGDAHVNRRYLPIVWIAIWFTASMLCSGSDPSHQLERTLGAADWSHPFGFDAFGRDMLVTVLRSSALSSGFAIVAVALSIVAGILIGSGIALAPRRWRFLLLRGLDSLLAFPYLLLALAWSAIRGPGWSTLLAALLIGTLPPFVRLMYARARELLAEDYVLAARSLGATPFRVISHHVAPSLFSLCGIKAPNLFAHALLAEATLSFLGVGVPIGRDSWGALLAQGKDYLLEAPHLAIGAGIPLVLTVFSLQWIAEEMTQKHLRRS
jgi:peptide/nickel transport system permease protein